MKFWESGSQCISRAYQRHSKGIHKTCQKNQQCCNICNQKPLLTSKLSKWPRLDTEEALDLELFEQAEQSRVVGWTMVDSSNSHHLQAITKAVAKRFRQLHVWASRYTGFLTMSYHLVSDDLISFYTQCDFSSHLVSSPLVSSHSLSSIHLSWYQLGSEPAGGSLDSDRFRPSPDLGHCLN